MTPDELRDRIKADADALYDHTQLPPPAEEWTPTPPKITADLAFLGSTEGTVWTRDKDDEHSWHGVPDETIRARMERLSGLALGGGRHLYKDGRFRLHIKGHETALHEVAFERAHFPDCIFDAEHYALFGGPLIHTLFEECQFIQRQGRETPVRLTGGDHLEFSGGSIHKKPGPDYNKSPFRMERCPGPVRLRNVNIHGGSCIHVGVGSENLVGGSNGHDENPCEQFEDIGGTFFFTGWKPDQPREAYRFTGLKSALLKHRTIIGANRTYSAKLISMHKLKNGLKPDIEIENLRYDWGDGGFDLSVDRNVRWI
jgi:hypothetical protein